MAHFLITQRNRHPPRAGGCARPKTPLTYAAKSALGNDMYCTSCGQQNYSDAQFCQNCGRELRRQESPGGGYPPSGIRGPRPNIPNHLVWAILVMTFCCQPTGIVAIVYAAQVNGKIDAGDYAGARRASNSARTWANVSMILGFVIVACWVLLFIAGTAISLS